MESLAPSTSSDDIWNRRRRRRRQPCSQSLAKTAHAAEIDAEPHRGQTSDRTTRAGGRGGWAHQAAMGAERPKSRLSLGLHSRFFGQGPKKWGGIPRGWNPAATGVWARVRETGWIHATAAAAQRMRQRAGFSTVFLSPFILLPPQVLRQISKCLPRRIRGNSRCG